MHRAQPNTAAVIEPQVDDARQGVLTLAQNYFTGGAFDLVAYPGGPRAVPDSVKLKLVLADSEEVAQAVCDYEDDSEPDAKRPRRFRNTIFGIAPASDEMHKAIRERRWVMAAEKVLKDYKEKTGINKQVEALMPSLTKRAQIAACRALARVVFQGRPSVSLEEKYMISEEGGLQAQQKGQNNLKRFLDDVKLVYQPSDALDVDLLLEKIISGATPSLDHAGAHPASAVHERALSSDKVRLMMDGSPVHKITLEVAKPEAAESLIKLAQHFGAQSLAHTMRTGGELRDGGSVRFMVAGVKVNSSIKPLGRAA